MSPEQANINEMIDAEVLKAKGLTVGCAPAEGDTVLRTVNIPDGNGATLLVNSTELESLRNVSPNSWTTVSLHDFLSLLMHDETWAVTDAGFTDLLAAYSQSPVNTAFPLQSPPIDPRDMPPKPGELTGWLVRRPTDAEMRQARQARQPLPLFVRRIYLTTEIFDHFIGKGRMDL